jgi:hypothetical protein
MGTISVFLAKVSMQKEIFSHAHHTSRLFVTVNADNV